MVRVKYFSLFMVNMVNQIKVSYNGGSHAIIDDRFIGETLDRYYLLEIITNRKVPDHYYSGQCADFAYLITSLITLMDKHSESLDLEKLDLSLNDLTLMEGRVVKRIIELYKKVNSQKLEEVVLS